MRTSGLASPRSVRSGWPAMPDLTPNSPEWIANEARLQENYVKAQKKAEDTRKANEAETKRREDNDAQERQLQADERRRGERK